ncbi:MAG TPA: hypothetical protein DCE23_00055 [Firmicutes bacterium]|nr:hypothetical protein [Bacillota bacterium]
MVGDDMKGKLLPIGSVVKIEGGSKKVMITGYYSKNDKDSKIYTYNGCIFPEGFMENTFLLFDAPQIEDVLYRGYENEDFDNYLDMITSSGNTFVNGIAFDNDNKSQNNTNKKNGRTPKAPTKPMSISEMRAKYTVEKISGGQSKKV